jgi:hypothetical protein
MRHCRGLTSSWALFHSLDPRINHSAVVGVQWFRYHFRTEVVGGRRGREYCDDGEGSNDEGDGDGEEGSNGEEDKIDGDDEGDSNWRRERRRRR